MSERQNDIAAKNVGASEAALRELEALAAEWIERQRQRLKAQRH